MGGVLAVLVPCACRFRGARWRGDASIGALCRCGLHACSKRQFPALAFFLRPDGRRVPASVDETCYDELSIPAETAMSKSLSPEAVEALRRLNDVGVGQTAPQLAQSVMAELLACGLVAEAGGGELEINCNGRQYLSGDCD